MKIERTETGAPIGIAREPAVVDCVLCHQPIVETDINGPHVYRQVTGYVAKRAAGGANSIRLKADTGRFAHKTCVDREARQGINAAQGELL